MLQNQPHFVPLKLKHPPSSSPSKRICERSSVPTSSVSHPHIFDYPCFNRMQSESFPYLYESDESVVVSAPTASGKTALMELGILRNLETSKGQVVYLAPLKALCQERKLDWSRRLGRIGLKCVEVTGDSEESDLNNFRKADVVLATPEKWDSVTRRGFAQVSLLLIDEVHILEQEGRGATLEAVVSRMKLLIGKREQSLRIIAISATIPNIEDIAAWLDTKLVLNYDSSYRPVPLTTKVLGYQKAQNQFKFEQALNFKLFNVIQRYSDQKATLVFCQTQKGTVNAAKRLVQDAGLTLVGSHEQGANLAAVAGRLKDRQLAEVLPAAVGFHNAGLSPEDRSLIESLFLSGDLLVLCTTSTLAIGVNLPCHLVIVKSTMAYRGSTEGYTEYSSLEVLQMIGRAGRPQFDQSGFVVIMTEIDKIKKYESLMLSQELIESALAKSMIEHLNAEIALGSITTENDSIAWLKSTFFYIRAKIHPEYYNLSKNVDRDLVTLTQKLIQELRQYQLIEEQNGKYISTSLGRAVSNNCVLVETVHGFAETVGMDISSEDLLKVIAAAKEFEGYPSKMDQRKDLNQLNTHPLLRYRLKGAISTSDRKVFLLLQAGLSSITVDSWELRQQIVSLFQVTRRVLNVLKEFCLFNDYGKPLKLALIWSQQVNVKMWSDEVLVCKQIPGIGEKLAKALAQGGVMTIRDLINADPRKVEALCGKNAPFGTNAKSFAMSIPKPEITVDVSAGVLNVQIRTESQPHPEVNSTAFLLLILESGAILAYRKVDLSQPRIDFSFNVKSNSEVLISVIVGNYGKWYVVSVDCCKVVTSEGLVQQAPHTNLHSAKVVVPDTVEDPNSDIDGPGPEEEPFFPSDLQADIEPLLPPPQPLVSPPISTTQVQPLPSSFFKGASVTPKVPATKSVSFASSLTFKAKKSEGSKEKPPLPPLKTPDIFLKAKENSENLPWFRETEKQNFPESRFQYLEPQNATLETNKNAGYEGIKTMGEWRKPQKSQLEALYGSAALESTVLKEIQRKDTQGEVMKDVSNLSPPTTSLDHLAYHSPKSSKDDFLSLFKDI